MLSRVALAEAAAHSSREHFGAGGGKAADWKNEVRQYPRGLRRNSYSPNIIKQRWGKVAPKKLYAYTKSHSINNPNPYLF